MAVEELVLILFMLMMCHTVNLMICRLAKPGKGRGWRRWWRRPVNQGFADFGEYSRLFMELKTTDHEEFYHYTRMTPEHFDWLLERVTPFLIKRSARRPLPTELRLAFTLGFLAHGDSIWGKKWAFRIGRSTAYKIIPETCEAIIAALQPLYLPPVTKQMWKEYADGFWTRWNFPNCVGALDGKHVRIKCPPNTGSECFNYKKFFSIVLMAACDANYRFTFAEVGFAGGMQDGQIWNNCDFGNSLENGTVDLPDPEPLPGEREPMPFTFVGDEAFALKSYMMRPYSKPKRRRGAQAAAQAAEQDNSEGSDDDHANEFDPALQILPLPRRIFNYRLSRARRVIENAFGILVAKWQILAGQICCKEQTAQAIVMALICLHNFLIDSEMDDAPNQRNYLRPGMVDGEGPNGELLENGEWREAQRADGALYDIGRVGGLNPARAAVEQRERIKDFFLTDIGELPWQYDYALRNVPVVGAA